MKKVKSGSEKMNSESPEIPGSTTLQDLRQSNKNYGIGFFKSGFLIENFNTEG